MVPDLVQDAVDLGELVGLFGGELIGDPKTAVLGIASLEEAGPQQLSFITQRRYRARLLECRAAAVLIQRELVDLLPPGTRGLWVTADPYLLFARVAQFFAARARPAPTPGVHPSALVDASAQIDPSASVGPAAVIGARVCIGANVTIGAHSVVGEGVTIGAGSCLYPRVTIYPDCALGARTVLHSGVVVGADGFGYARDGFEWVKIPQTGRVVIGDDVEIGANTTIDRGALGDTVIGAGVKMDNQVQIGHNVRVGAHTAIAGCAGVAGSATIGARCMIGGAAMILGHLELADDVSISVGTVISHSIQKPGLYTGFFPSAENAAWEKNAVVVRHLDTLRDRVRALERQLRKGQGST
jgi:UDP-3-O-[3-hydroxymyristoyl] glucosamine N-acyltransferase